MSNSITIKDVRSETSHHFTVEGQWLVDPDDGYETTNGEGRLVRARGAGVAIIPYSAIPPRGALFDEAPEPWLCGTRVLMEVWDDNQACYYEPPANHRIFATFEELEDAGVCPGLVEAARQEYRRIFGADELPRMDYQAGAFTG